MDLVILLDEETNQRWKRSLPFRVHSAAHDSGKIGALCGHGFHLLRVSDGTQIGEEDPPQVDSATFYHALVAVGFYPAEKDNCTCSIKKMRIETFGRRRVRRLIGWFDREHLMWQDEDGKLRCARLLE